MLTPFYYFCCRSSSPHAPFFRHSPTFHRHAAGAEPLRARPGYSEALTMALLHTACVIGCLPYDTGTLRKDVLQPPFRCATQKLALLPGRRCPELARYLSDVCLIAKTAAYCLLRYDVHGAIGCCLLPGHYARYAGAAAVYTTRRRRAARQALACQVLSRKAAAARQRPCYQRGNNEPSCKRQIQEPITWQVATAAAKVLPI